MIRRGRTVTRQPRIRRAGVRHLAAAAATAVGVVFAGGALALAPVTAAAAHDYLVDADPGAGSTVTTSVNKVTLTFSDVVLALGNDGSSSILQVTDADGRHYETACAVTQGRSVIAPVALGGAGTYTVTFQIVSSDGHTVSDDYAFDYRPPADAEPATGTERSVCAAAQQQSSAPTAAAGEDDAAASREAGEAAIGTVLTVVGIIFALVVAGVIAALILARKKPRT